MCVRQACLNTLKYEQKVIVQQNEGLASNLTSMISLLCEFFAELYTMKEINISVS